jgi:hypothetical protein
MYVPPENVVVKLPKLASVGTTAASVGVYVKSVRSGVVGVAHLVAVAKAPAAAPPTELLPPEPVFPDPVVPPELAIAPPVGPAAPPSVPMVPPVALLSLFELTHPKAKLAAIALRNAIWVTVRR